MRKSKKSTGLDLDAMPLKDLIDLEVKVKKAIANMRDKERSELRKKMAEMADAHGFSVNELFGGRGAGKGKKQVGIAKYANPDNKSDTWTGRGRKPNWVLAFLKKGGKLSDVAI